MWGRSTRLRRHRIPCRTCGAMRVVDDGAGTHPHPHAGTAAANGCAGTDAHTTADLSALVHAHAHTDRPDAGACAQRDTPRAHPHTDGDGPYRDADAQADAGGAAAGQSAHGECGKGNAGAKGGPAGDLLIAVEEQAQEQFSRDGSNLLYDLYINFADAALGAKVELHTLEGEVRITVPPGTQAGKIFRLKDKGLPELQSRQRGDLLVHVNVWTPKKLSDEERRMLEKMREMSNFKPSPGKDERSFFDRVKDMFSE